MKSIEWIDKLIETRKLPSDRQAALLLGMTASGISHHRNGKTVTLDDVYAYRLEELLDLPHGTIVADQHAAREKNPAIAAMWQRLGKLAIQAGAAALTIGTIFLAPTANIDAHQQLAQNSADKFYIMLNNIYTEYHLA